MCWCAALRTSWRMTSAEKTHLSGCAACSVYVCARFDDRSHRNLTVLYGGRSNVEPAAAAVIIVTIPLCSGVSSLSLTPYYPPLIELSGLSPRPSCPLHFTSTLTVSHACTRYSCPSRYIHPVPVLPHDIVRNSRTVTVTVTVINLTSRRRVPRARTYLVVSVYCSAFVCHCIPVSIANALRRSSSSS
ncbi:hypothetical protein OH76DRAFT_1201079 [Lentinus brumalis]|uniref:Uncharacterized protein n=1 Tax=Lentinus brumalis TaxID=2498619 RepID=A0A371CT77_9APHY|nr:hypothetical protein OH76DRAFT_1201079 [Polyporus brumalis]